MVLLRLSPLIPYNALDYMSGITAIPLWAYSLALIGLLPGTISLCFIGASASSLTDGSSSENMTMKIVTIVAGVAFAVSGVAVASYYSKRELEMVSQAKPRRTDLFDASNHALWPLKRYLSRFWRKMDLALTYWVTKTTTLSLRTSLNIGTMLATKIPSALRSRTTVCYYGAGVQRR